MSEYHFKLFIDGKWVASSTNQTENILSPTDESIVGSVHVGGIADAEKALKAAEVAQKKWRKVPAKKRADLLRKLAEEIRSNKDLLAPLLVREQGKLLSWGYGETEATSTFLEYACEWARHIEGDMVPSDNEGEQIWITKVPRGVVVAITAWNFPLALAARKLGPALIAGNTVVLKPTPDAPLASLMLCDMANTVGIPAGVINMVTGGVDVGQFLVEHPITKMITMTGSTPTGQAIFRSAANTLAHVQLELGGKAPCIVFEDADLEEAASSALHSRFDNCGQICTCNERMYVHEAIYDDFLEIFMNKVKGLKVGDPMKEDTDIGPKMNETEVKKMEAFVADSLANGANLLYGGSRPKGAEFAKGHWFEPTILDNVQQDMRIVKEEIFGPILPIIKFNDFDQVIGFANDSDFGLAAMVFTKDFRKIMRLQSELEFGEIYINRGHGEQHQGFHNGLKLSGTGGEDGKYGFDQYLEKKTFYVKY